MKIIDIWYKKIKKDFLDNKNIIVIPDFINIEELLLKLKQDKTLNLTDKVLQNKTYHYKIIIGNELTNEQIEKIRKEHLEFYIINKKKTKQISEKIILDQYTKSTLKTKKYITLYLPLSNNDIENFKYINEKTVISLSYKTEEIDELVYFINIKNIIKKLSNENKKYKIAIKVTNRQTLEDSKLLQNIPSNINIHISNNNASYTKTEFLEEERILNLLIDPIKTSNLSPLEKYIAVYNIVKKFKEYKENEKSPEQARILKHIINNDHIVCGGFSTLLQVMLQKVNIQSSIIYMEVEDKSDKKNHSGHVRNIIKIDDDKYNIHGIYLADTTWDNNLKEDLYLNILLTYDEKKEAKSNEYLIVEDMLFDFHDFEEYNIKLNTLLYKTSKNVPEQKEKDRYAKSYITIYNHILEHLKFLDYQKYIYFYDKYQKNIHNIDNLKRQESYSYAFFTEYGLYIIPLSNKKVPKETIMNAALITKKEIDNMDESELENWKKDVIELNNDYFTDAFPYIFDYQKEKETYLANRKK